MPQLPRRRFSILYVDPPWDYKGQSQHNGKGKKLSGGAKTHYPTVTTKELMTWDIPSICHDDCLLFMWTSSPHLDQAIELGKAWGFKYSTVAFVWEKQKTNPGSYTMSECEMCLVFKRGKIPLWRGSRKERQFLSIERTEHSVKPDEVRDRITNMFPQLEKLEMFARQGGMQWEQRGWNFWGNEIQQHPDDLVMNPPSDGWFLDEEQYPSRRKYPAK